MSFDPSLFVPPSPFHFLVIIHYVTLAFIIYMVISPHEGGILFMILMAVTALLVAVSIYSPTFVSQRFLLFGVRTLAIVIPLLMAGTAQNKDVRQTSLIVSGLSAPGVAIMLMLPFLDFYP